MNAQVPKKRLLQVMGILSIAILLVFSVSIFSRHHNSMGSSQGLEIHTSGSEELPNSEIINTMFYTYIDEYNELGYYPSYYKPSLQATYYTLSILSDIGRLGEINQSAIIEFIMEHYNASTGFFSDEYAFRYLDTDFSLRYYPLSTLLEVNAYAVLSLDLLGEIQLIDNQTMVEFMWSCQNPFSGGFMGRPYNPDLNNYFKLASLDNTYFGVKVLDRLLPSWTGYSEHKGNITDFITESQELNPSDPEYGAFYDNPEQNYRLLGHHDPSIHSCYYAIKVLELFEVVNSIDSPAFHDFLSKMYHENEYWFQIADSFSFERQCIYSATAMGLELSLITGFTDIDEPNILNYLLSHRNSLGIWNVNDLENIYELIDTFQIIRSVSNTGNINNLDSIDRDNIVNALESFRSYRGYSFKSSQFTKVSQIYSLAESFQMYDRIGDLDILELYYAFEDAYWEYSQRETRVFYGYLNANGEYAKFRLEPIEFNSYGTREHINYADYLTSHKWTYMAMKAMDKMLKLDDFDNYHNLTELLDRAVACQITDPDSEKFGGFLPYDYIKLYPTEIQEEFTYFDHAYYAIKTIEFLTEWLGVGTITDTVVDTDALFMYLAPLIVETPDELYCQQTYITRIDPELRLEHTFYLAELYQILNYPSLNTQKIKTFVENSLDYTNLKNLYYCYKLNELLSLDINFNLDLTHQLIKDIYDPTEDKLYLNPKHEEIDPLSFYWVCYMVHHDGYKFNLDYESVVQLNGQNLITATICNIILDTADTYHTVKLESDILGTFTLTETENETYEFLADIPLDPSYYPTITGELCLYEGPFLIASEPFTFDTTYELNYEFQAINNSDVQEFFINASLSTYTGLCELSNGEGIIRTHRNGELLYDNHFSVEQMGTYTEFSKSITLPEYGEYRFDLYLNDGFNETEHYIGSHTYLYQNTSDSGSDDPPADPDPDPNPDSESSNQVPVVPPPVVLGVSIPLFVLCTVVIGYTTYRKKSQTNT